MGAAAPKQKTWAFLKLMGPLETKIRGLAGKRPNFLLAKNMVLPTSESPGTRGVRKGFLRLNLFLEGAAHGLVSEVGSVSFLSEPKKGTHIFHVPLHPPF